MNIAYCTNVRLPSERAHGHQVAQVCDALARLGHLVHIFVPFRHNPVSTSYHDYYSAQDSVSITHLGSIDPILSRLFPGILGLWMLNALFQYHLPRAIHKGEFDILYTRTWTILSALLKIGTPVALELHELPRFGRRRFVRRCNQCASVICLTSPMRDILLSWGVNADRISVEGDAVDLRRFEEFPSEEEAQEKYGISTDKVVIGYIGRLKTHGMEKGVRYLLGAIAKLKDRVPVFGCIVGGPKGDEDEYRTMAMDLGLTDEDVLFTGAVPSQDVASALAACDVLTMPFPDYPHYRTNMSPLKMFEYMAANRPIITSDLPTVRDVLSEATAYFCRPDSSESLAKVIEEVVSHYGQAQEKARCARDLVEREWTWEKRMQRIIDRIPSVHTS